MSNQFSSILSITMEATSDIFMHSPQLSHILSGLMSQSSHSPQPIHFLSYNTQSSPVSYFLFPLVFSIRQLYTQIKNFSREF